MFSVSVCLFQGTLTYLEVFKLPPKLDLLEGPRDLLSFHLKELDSDYKGVRYQLIQQMGRKVSPP